jgi:hypothetical protein
MLIAVAENYEMTSAANSKTEVTCCSCRRLENFINMDLIFQNYIGIQATQAPYFMFYICSSYFVANFIRQVTSVVRCSRAHRNVVLWYLWSRCFFLKYVFLSVCRLYHKANDRPITWNARMHSSLSEFILIFLRKESGRLMGLIKSDGCHGYGFWRHCHLKARTDRPTD